VWSEFLYQFSQKAFQAIKVLLVAWDGDGFDFIAFFSGLKNHSECELRLAPFFPLLLYPKIK
jgi:hypothetical protein